MTATGTPRLPYELDARADEEHHRHADEAADRADERDRAGAAVGRVLLGQPQRVEREVRAAEAEEEDAARRTTSARRAQVEHVAEGDDDADAHEREVDRHRLAAGRDARPGTAPPGSR